MIRIRVKLTIVFCIRLLEVPAYGAYRDPIAKTNINSKTDLFEKEIEDYGTFRDHMGSLREQAARGIASPGNLELISDKTDDEIKAATSNLSTIRATDLQVKGQEEVLRTGIMEELHVDYTKPLNIGHKKDASRIAEASGDLLKKLTELFKEFGIDCRTVKGNKVIEPEYYIEIKKEGVKDTVYTKTMCEEPRNSYKCYDVLTTRCIRRGAVGELKHAFRSSGFTFGCQLSHFYERNSGYNPCYWTGERGEIDLAPFFPEIKRMLASSCPHYTLSTEVPFELVDVNKIVLPPQRHLPLHLKVQKRTGEWFEPDWPAATRSYGAYPLYYYDEGCVEWVDEWDEVCGLES